MFNFSSFSGESTEVIRGRNMPIDKVSMSIVRRIIKSKKIINFLNFAPNIYTVNSFFYHCSKFEH